MNYLVISPYYPQNFQQFTIELANKGITVLGIGQESYEQLDEPLRNSLTEYFRVDNLENIDEVKRAVAFLFYKHGPINRIESHNEYWLELDATLREQFNVFGAKPEDLKKTKYKSEMKKLFKKAGVPVVPGAVIKTEADVDQAVKEIGLPMIAKPDNGVGAAATFKLETEDDINHFKQEWDHSTLYFFEKFVTSSEICTFDGLVDKDGKIVFSTTFDYAYTPLDLMIYKMDNSYYVLKDMVPKLRKYGEAIVKEFGMKERFFHIEFFREGDDYIAIEYNNRPAGGFTIDVYNFAHSLDLYRGYAAIVAGEEFPASEFEPQYCLATSRRANAHYVYSEENLLVKYSQQFKVKKIMPEAFAELQGRIESLNELDFRVRMVLDTVYSYRKLESWQNLTAVTSETIQKNLSPLLFDEDKEDEMARRFDLWLLHIQLGQLTAKSSTVHISQVMKTARALSAIGNIPQVFEQAEIIRKVQKPEFWKEVNLSDLEKIRLAIRDLLQFLDKTDRKPYYVNFEDRILSTVHETTAFLQVNDLRSYNEKVEHYLKTHLDEESISKLYHNKKLTSYDMLALEKLLWEKLGSKADYQSHYENKAIPRLVREIIGLDRESANRIFSKFLSDENLNARQISFVKLIVDYIVENGFLETKVLTQEPFKSYGSVQLLFQHQLPVLRNIVQIIELINNRAGEAA